MAFSFDTGLLDDWSQERFNATKLPELDWSKEGQMLGRGLRQNAIRNAMEGVHQETPAEHKAKIDEAMRQWAAKNPQGPGESDTDYYGRVKEFANNQLNPSLGQSTAAEQFKYKPTAGVSYDQKVNALEQAVEGTDALDYNLNDAQRWRVADSRANGVQVQLDNPTLTDEQREASIGNQYNYNVTEAALAQKPMQDLSKVGQSPLDMSQVVAQQDAEAQARYTVPGQQQAEGQDSYAARAAAARQGFEEANPIQTKADYYDQLADKWLRFDPNKAMEYKKQAMEYRQEQNVRDITAKGMEEASNSPNPADGYRKLAKQLAQYDQGAATELWKAAAEYDMRKAQMNWSMRPTQDQYSQVFATMRGVKTQDEWNAERKRLMQINPGVEIPAKMAPESLDNLSYRAGANEKFSGPQPGTFQWADAINKVNDKKSTDLRIIYGDMTSAPPGTYTVDQLNEARNEWTGAKNAYLESNAQLMSGKYTGGQFASSGIKGDISAPDISPTNIDVFSDVDKTKPAINGVYRRTLKAGLVPTTTIKNALAKNDLEYEAESKKNSTAVIGAIEKPEITSRESSNIATSLNAIMTDDTKTDEQKTAAAMSWVSETQQDANKKGILNVIMSAVPGLHSVTKDRPMTMDELKNTVIQANIMATSMHNLDAANFANVKTKMKAIADQTPMTEEDRAATKAAIDKMNVPGGGEKKKEKKEKKGKMSNF